MGLHKSIYALVAAMMFMQVAHVAETPRTGSDFPPYPEISDFSHSDELPCIRSNVIVHSKDRDDADSACEAAIDAFDFLAQQGLETSMSVHVHLLSKLNSPCLEESFGCYDHTKLRIEILNLSECIKRRTWGSLPVSRRLCKSLLTHEVAHAVAASNFSMSRPNMLAQEYLAFVTMFATMPPKQRDSILEQFPGEGFDSVDQMSTAFYLMNPALFGLRSYQHFIKVHNKKAFLKAVLSGQILFGESEF